MPGGDGDNRSLDLASHGAPIGLATSLRLERPDACLETRDRLLVGSPLRGVGASIVHRQTDAQLNADEEGAGEAEQNDSARPPPTPGSSTHPGAELEPAPTA